jgi:cysteine desulfurase/selenocysteine lyase
MNPSFYEYNTWMGIPDRIRNLFAEVFSFNPMNVAHFTSSSEIINTVAYGLNLKSDDVVVTIDKDYPSNVISWMLAAKHKGFQHCSLENTFDSVPTVEWLKENLPKNTKVFNCSYVTFDTGKRLNILEIGNFLKERDIMYVVDATQALGGLSITPEEMENIDVMACSSYKWLLGPYGHAFGIFSKKAQEMIEYHNASWTKSINSKDVGSLLKYTTETLPGARKYDRGQAASPLIMSCLQAGLELFKDIGIKNIENKNADVRDHFLENYPQSKYELITPKEHLGNIICLKAKSLDSKLLERELKSNNIDVSVREGNIRLSFHLFNSKDQVNKAIRALDI